MPFPAIIFLSLSSSSTSCPPPPVFSQMASELGLVFLISWRLEAKSSNELLMDWKWRVALLEMSELGAGDGHELATTNHLKGAILLQCKPFTSREDQGLNWLS